MDEQKEKFLKDRIDACPFNLANGVHAVKAEDGRAVVSVTLTRDSMNIWGIPHGGLLFTLGDVAAGLAAQTVCDGSVVSVSGTIDFLSAARGADSLSAEASVIKKGKTIAFVRVQITDDHGSDIAAAQYVMHLS